MAKSLSTSLLKLCCVSVIEGKDVLVSESADIMQIRRLCRHISCCTLTVISIAGDTCYLE